VNLVAELDLGRVGRRPEPLEAEVERELTPEDIEFLNTNRGSRHPTLRSLRSRHHALARCIASGMKDYEASAATGYDVARISILKSDPMFQDLIWHYRDTVEAEYADLHQRLSHLSLVAAEELLDRLEDDPADISINALSELVKMGADRTGHGPQTKSQNTHLHVVNIADRLDAARRRVSANRTLELPSAVVEGPDEA
jgi:hypothetical protein